jgi:hypothetical protein
MFMYSKYGHATKLITETGFKVVLMGFSPLRYCKLASYPVQVDTTIIYSNVSKNHIGT